MEALRAAVQNGADAVYLGAGGFNARMGARNFTLDDLREAVTYCHVRGVHVHLTVNTLCTDRELHQALGALIEVRVAKRAINSARAVKMLLGELDRLSGGRREDKLLLLRQSVTNSWKSVFPLRRGDGFPSPETAPSAPDRVVEEEGTYRL